MRNRLRKSTLLVATVLVIPAFAESITAVLKLKEKVTMEQLAANVRNPSSDHYRRFYTPAEIRELSAPTESEYRSLIDGLKQQGYLITSESPTHLWVSVKVERSVLNARTPFHVSMIQSVSGLGAPRKSHPRLRFANARVQSMGGIDPATIRTSYGFDPIYKAGIDGTGQHIAIATYDGLYLDNVRQYYKLVGLSPMPTVDQVEFNGTPVYSQGSAAETELDSELSGMIAPGVSIHVFASKTNDDPGELQMFTAILDDNRAKVVNYSWGGCEAEVSPAHKDEMGKVFARAVAQGVNIFVASGDSGSDSCQNGKVMADWPAASPDVVSVGGTSFGQTAGVIAETGWDGSGGGISGIWDLPTWQATLGSPFLKRSYPDVSFNADPYTGQAIYTGTPGSAGFQVVGGTSMSSPQWAGFLALVGQARQMAGKSEIGFINPIIYGLTAEEHMSLFHDVVSGSNGAYNSAGGWDAVTGFGSMQADALLGKLQSY